MDTAHFANFALKQELLHEQRRTQSHDSCMVESNFWNWESAGRFKEKDLAFKDRVRLNGTRNNGGLRK
jgi:hypothetical protein